MVAQAPKIVATKYVASPLLIPSSFVIAPNECTPTQKRLNAAVNALEIAYERGDTERIPALSAKADHLLQALVRSAGDGHSDPHWLVLTQKANVASAQRRLEEAIAFECAAFRTTTNPLHSAKNLNNISDHLRRAGRVDEALPYAVEAVQQHPENDGFASTLAAVLYECNRPRDADRVIESVAARTEIARPSNLLALHLLYQPELRNRWDRDPIAAAANEMIV